MGEEKALRMLIDEKRKVRLGGVDQKIHIRSRDPAKPVLLFLHGGPGVSNRHAVMRSLSDLCDDFTIVAWDQRGTGGSAYGVPKKSLTIERLTDDAAELAQWLCKRFDKRKIFVVGGSWGSELGIWLCKRYPEHIGAFIGYGQLVNVHLNEVKSWEFTLKQAKEAGDDQAVETLTAVGPPLNGLYKGGFGGMLKQRKLMMKYGGFSPNESRRSYASAMVMPILKSGEYSPADLFGLIFGSTRVLKAMWEEIGLTDFPSTCTEFDVPIFIFDGKHDYNTPWELVEDWYNMIKAPVKELVWFENSGHNPPSDEPELFKKLLRDRLLKLVRPGSGL